MRGIHPAIYFPVFAGFLLLAYCFNFHPVFFVILLVFLAGIMSNDESRELKMLKKENHLKHQEIKELYGIMNDADKAFIEATKIKIDLITLLKIAKNAEYSKLGLFDKAAINGLFEKYLNNEKEVKS